MSHSKGNTQGSEHTGNKTGLAGARVGPGKSPVPHDRFIDFLPDPTFASGTVILWNKALEVFSRDPHAFDLVITDQTIPLLTGTELAAKKLAIRSGIPIILITGFSEMVSAEQAREQGISVYPEKPFTRKSVAAAISRALSAF
jgi:DNA-binding NtrC family response regulator